MKGPKRVAAKDAGKTADIFQVKHRIKKKKKIVERKQNRATEKQSAEAVSVGRAEQLALRRQTVELAKHRRNLAKPNGQRRNRS